jgi:hypothetical protein
VRALLVPVISLAFLLSPRVDAHPLSFGSARLERVGVDLVGQLVLDVPDAVLSKSDGERRRDLDAQVKGGLHVEVGSGATTPEIRIEDLGRGEQAVDIVSVRYAIGSATVLRFISTKELGDLAIEVVDKERSLRERLILPAGTRSEPVELVSRPTPVGNAPPGESAAHALPTRQVQTILDYARLGFRHIVPGGVDHLLFVTTLVLLARAVGQLLVLVSLFTVGHALSVALAVYGVASLEASWVEPLIALSLAYGAFEHQKPALSPMRPAVVLAFGVVHGLGFADALGRVGVPQAERLVAILGFNFGVEVGQVLVAFVPLSLLFFLQRRGPVEVLRFRALLAIGVVGVIWAVLRILGLV